MKNTRSCTYCTRAIIMRNEIMFDVSLDVPPQTASRTQTAAVPPHPHHLKLAS